MRSYLSLSVFALSMAAAAVACSGSGGSSNPGDDDTTSSSGSGGASSGNASSSSGSGSGSSGQQTSSSSGGSSSGAPIDPGKPGAACDAPSECDDKVCVEHTCRAATATDAVKNGNESGIDCGNSGTGTNTSAPGCATGGACTVAADCLDKSCNGTVCLAPTSTDTIQNGNETGVDCGASGTGLDTDADKCGDTVTCGVANDCASGVCNVTCQVPTNQDEVKNGNETGVDCGSGPMGVDTDAVACEALQGCLADTDCESLVCFNLICQAPSCIDSKKNGTETAINCGGDACGPCADNLGCLVAADCTSKVCGNVDKLCKVPTSTDNVKNGNETGLDCGNSNIGTDTTARACKDTEVCNDDGDCKSGKCTGNTCRVPTKTDGVKNGRETDVDCGSGGPVVVNDPYYGTTENTLASACADLLACVGVADCTSGVCTTSTCRVPTYADGVKNGNETDLNCGGEAAVGSPAGSPGARGNTVTAQNNRCVADQVCVIDEDCKSDACSGGKCLLARSCAMAQVTNSIFTPAGATDQIRPGGDTCGTGDSSFPSSATEPSSYSLLKKHESCCTSIPVTTPGNGQVLLDKYQITAGRMRKFIETLANDPVKLDDVNVKAWVDAAAPIVAGARSQADASVMDVTQLPIAHENLYPTSWNTPVAAANDCGQNGNLPCNYGWAAHLGGFRYNLEPGGAGGYGCQMGTNANGSRTFYFPDASPVTQTAPADRYRNFNGETQHKTAKNRLDQKSLDCVDLIMLEAFCAWDGGRLETREEHEAAYGAGTFPWSTSTSPDNTIKPLGFTGVNSGAGTGPGWAPDASGNPGLAALPRFLRANWFWNYSNMYVSDRWWFYARDPGRGQRTLFGLESLDDNDLKADETPAVAPPGRFPLGAGPLGHRDLAGNMMEITASALGDGRFWWTKNGSFEGGAHTSLDSGGYTGFAFTNRAKYGRAGGRCVRPLSGYPAKKIPKR